MKPLVYIWKLAVVCLFLVLWVALVLDWGSGEGVEVTEDEEAIRWAAINLFAYDENIDDRQVMMEKWEVLPMDKRQDYLTRVGTVLHAYLTAKQT